MRDPNENKLKIWQMACLTAPIAHRASGMPWNEVLIAALLAAGISGLFQENRKTIPWLRRLVLLTAAGQGLLSMSGCWPGQRDMNWVMGILLILAVLMTWKNRESTIRSGILLWWLTAFLFGSVLLSAIPEMERNNLRPYWGKKPGQSVMDLLGILILPALMEEKHSVNGTAGIRLILSPLLFSLCSVGVIGKNMGEIRAPFYELSRSIRLYGLLDRMEGLAWLGLMIGTVLYLSFLMEGLLQRGEQNREGKTILGAAAAAAISILLKKSELPVSAILTMACTIAEYLYEKLHFRSLQKKMQEIEKRC